MHLNWAHFQRTMSHELLLRGPNEHHAESHASRHYENAADELDVAALGSGAATSGQVATADGTGGVGWITPASTFVGLTVDATPVDPSGGRITLSDGNGVNLTPTANTVAFALAPLTADYTQSGAFDWIFSAGAVKLYSGVDFSIYSDAGSTLVAQIDGATGHIGVGSVAAMSTTKTVAIDDVIANSSARGLSVDLQVSASGNAIAAGAYIIARHTSSVAGSQNSFFGLLASAVQEGTRPITTLAGLYGEMRSLAGGTGAITVGYGLLINTAVWQGDVPVNTYGARFRDQGGTGATAYGIYVDAQTGTTAKSFMADPLAMGSDSVDASSLADFNSTTKGIRPPRMTTAQRDAIGSPAEGLLIYNTSTDQYEYYNAATPGWQAIAGAGGAHSMLDGSTHSDSVADTVSRGSLIAGNATPAWDELPAPSPTSKSNTTPSSYGTSNWGNQAGTARKVLVYDGSGDLVWDYITAVDVLTPAQVVTFSVQPAAAGYPDDTSGAAMVASSGTDTPRFAMTYQGTATAATIDIQSETYGGNPEVNPSDYPTTVLTPFTSHDGPAINRGAAVAESVTFRITATVDGQSKTKDVTLTYVNERMWGVSTVDDIDTQGEIDTFRTAQNKELSNGIAKTFTVTAGTNEYIYWIQREALGTPTFTVGGFEGGFSQVGDVSWQNPRGFTENYDVWRSDNHSLGSTTVTVS